MYKILNYTLLYLLIFDLGLPGLPIIPSASLVLIICLIIFPFFRNRIQNNVFDHFKGVIILYLIIFTWTLFRVSFSEDIGFLLSTLKALSVLFASIFYLKIFYDNKTIVRLINIFFINAIICLIIGTYSEYHYLIAPFQHDIGDKVVFNNYRISFLAGSGFFGIAVPFIIAFCFFEYLIVQSKIKLSIILGIKLLVILLGAVFAGRISIPIILLSFMYFILTTKRFYYIIYYAIFILLIYWVLNLEQFAIVRMWIDSMFFDNDTLIENSSANHLLSMIRFPKYESTILFGDGMFTNYYMGIDIGYLRHLYFGGVFFMILPLFIMPILYFKNKNIYFILFLYPVGLILHFKGLVMMNNPMFMSLIFIISYYMQENNLKSKLLIK